MLYTTALLEVRARLQELVADFWLDNELYRALNEGVTRFAQEEKWPYLYTLVSGLSHPANQTTMQLQPGVAYTRHFNLIVTFSGDDRPRKVKRVHPSEGYNLRSNFYTAQSEPMVYYIENELRVGQDEIQSIINSGSTAGNFTLTYDGQTTGSISRGATAATIETALWALSNIDEGEVECWGGPLGTDRVYVRFQNDLGGINVSAMTLGGTTTNMTIAEYAAGGAGAGAYTPVIRFVPEMNRIATVEYQYIRDPVLVTSPTTESLDIPDEYAMGVCAYAAGHAFLKELNFSKKADEQFALYQKSVQDAKRESRKVTPDSGLVWGRTEPQYGWTDPDAELDYSITYPLG